MRLMSGVGLGLEIWDVSGLDIEQGAVGVVDLAGVGGASAVQKFPNGLWWHLLHSSGKYLGINKEPAHA